MSVLLRALVPLATVLATALAGAPASATSASAETSGSSDASASATSRPSTAPTRGDRAIRARDIALRQIGDPYAYGASGPNAFDCSGLVRFATHQAGFTRVPRTSAAQSGFARRIPKSALRPGDLMFFYGSGGVYHAAMFLRWDRGRALMVHAPGSGSSVRRAVPWTTSWFAGTLR